MAVNPSETGQKVAPAVQTDLCCINPSGYPYVEKHEEHPPLVPLPTVRRGGVEAKFNSLLHAKNVINGISEEDREVFSDLSKTWDSETAHMQFIHQKIEHPSYKQIVEMGEKAVPLILEDVRENPSWLFVALYELTDEDPTRDDESIIRKDGSVILDFDIMRNGWLKWGEEKGYLQRQENTQQK